jgi:hypothetical protein
MPMKTFASVLPLLIGVCLAAPAQQVAFVDLTSRPSDAAPGPTGSGRVSGGGVFDHPGPRAGTPTLRLELLRLATYTEKGITKQAIELTLTNGGAKDIALPVGKESASLLAPGNRERQYIWIDVYAGTRQQGLIAKSTAAANGDDPKSVLLIHPGEYVLFRVPVDGYRADDVRRSSAGANLELRAVASLWRVSARDGEDWKVQVGDELKSENALSWR